jgi:hypothetical protein
VEPRGGEGSGGGERVREREKREAWRGHGKEDHCVASSEKV